MSAPKPEKSMDELVMAFAEETVQQNVEIRRGSRKGSDIAHERRVKAFECLTGYFGNSGREALKVLFGHPDARVRIMAACYLLRYCTNEALEVLNGEVENGDGYTSYAARIGIMNWEKGEWSLDP